MHFSHVLFKICNYVEVTWKNFVRKFRLFVCQPSPFFSKRYKHKCAITQIIINLRLKFPLFGLACPKNLGLEEGKLFTL